jgi:hypothetical protein
MQFRTQIPIPLSNHLIDYTVKMVSLGSYFAENISLNLTTKNFKTIAIFGIIFNLISIEN